MTPQGAKQELENRLRQAGKNLVGLTPSEGLRIMLAFYREVRADGCRLDANGDMLLYQWGTHGFGQEPSFQFDLTRQFMLDDTEDEDDDAAMSQLSLTFHFPKSPQFYALGNGNRWCETPDECANFEVFITGSAAYRAIQAAPASKVELDFQDGL